jgi:2-methylcitrate dehydratase PrpD
MTADAAPPPSGVEHLGDFVALTPRGALPEAVCRMVRQAIVDTVGVALGGLSVETVQPLTEFLVETAKEGPCTLIGRSERLSPPGAALYNGTLAHALDFDDTHMPTVVHPSACTLPVALALGQRVGADFQALVEAVALGNEVALRIGMAAHDDAGGGSRLIATGRHPSGFCGPLGAAAAAARILGLPPAQTAHALAIAANLAFGTLEPNRAGGTLKRSFCGWAAQSGLVAAELARRGITGPASALEGEFGLLGAQLGAPVAPDRLTGGLGRRWEVSNTGFKPYPCNVYTHSAIDAARAALDRHGPVDPVAVTHIEVTAPGPVAAVVGAPIARKRRPQSSHEARFSIPFVVARTLLGAAGTAGPGPEDFADAALNCPATLALAGRTDVVADPALERDFPRRVPCRIVLNTDAGRLTAEVATARGSRDTPLGEDDLRAKFLRLAAPRLGAGTAGDWADRVLSGKGFTDIEAMLAPLAGPTGG